MDRIAAMNIFVRVVETGSFTRAADALNLPKTTVTRLVNDLEQSLAVSLLRRSSRSLRLTPEGERYHARALRFLAELHDIEAQTRQLIARPSGRVRVEVPAGLASLVIVPALRDFLDRYPDIQVELEVGGRSQSLVADSIDCALRLGVPDEQFLVVRRIGEFQFVTCGSPEYLERHGTPRQPADLHGQHCLLGLTTAGSHRPLAFRFRQGEVEVEVLSTGQFTFNDANACLAAAVAGLGLIQAPAYALGDALERGLLLPVLENCTMRGTVPTYVAYPPNRFLSAKVRVFIDWLVDLCERHPQLKRQ